jgi:T4 bacteriophage base plate protein
MALPKIDKPLFEVNVPSTGKAVKFRPFLVKEEKILLVAQASDNDKGILTAIKQVINNCVVDRGFNIDNLTTFDVEYLFLKLRARSVNNVIEVSYRDLEDNELYKFEIDLDEVEITKTDNISTKIQITEEVGLVMKYPSIALVDNIAEDAEPSATLDYLIRGCIDQVYDSENVYMISEQTQEEVEEFIDNLDVATFEKIRDFFDNIPKMYYKLEYKNKLGNDRVIELQSLRDFFTWG